ncbi:[NiFe]-hydrogenase assembly chaperone HybE [Magnetospirillum molischianum]|uniref:Hydrogenase expression/formation protein hupJ n=1 Tax=Magnetospirillum molischianum DSM 120 TaxID=1150626 RepID=H8FMT3_MAGML|nr:[NiFe]-hydrogenase assembly chaperone HybE [Magnetospirillum molischianum]CCG39671.1 hydrogenase expression/formation protein hupJ [Magnetospirillum molischianum DSM 120]
MMDAARQVGDRLEAIYREIDIRSMRDLPIHNPRLEVQAVGFRPHRGWAIGALVTPWFMNICLAEIAGGSSLPPALPGDSHALALPLGTLDFVVGSVEGFGRLDSVSLFSPMVSFDDPEVTRITATAALAALFESVPSPAALAVPRNRREMLFGRGAVVS